MGILKKSAVALAVTSTLITSHAMAAGFQLNSQSAVTIGRASAGEAIIADNASVLSKNPAAMALFDRPALSLGLTYGDLDISVNNASYNAVPIDANGTPSGALLNSDIGDAGAAKVIPNAYYIHPINDDFAFGLGLFSNFGTGTDTSSLQGLGFAEQFIGETTLSTVTLNASVSYRLNQQISVGLGLDLVYGAGEITRPSASLPYDFSTVDADGYALGGIIGGTYEVNDTNRFGISYRFSPEVTASGTIEILGSDYDELAVPLPDVFQFAGYHRPFDKFAVHYTAQWTQWSTFDKLTATGGPSGNATDLKVYEWEDSWLYSIGATYYFNDQWEVRAGYMRDNGVVGEESHPSVSIPDSDRNWYTAGASWHVSKNTSLDFGLAFVQGEDVNVVEQGGIGDSLEGTTSSSVVYYSLSYNYLF